MKNAVVNLNNLLALPTPLVDDGAARHVEEGATALAGDGSRQHRLAGARRTVEKHPSPGLQETSEHVWITDQRIAVLVST